MYSTMIISNQMTKKKWLNFFFPVSLNYYKIYKDTNNSSPPNVLTRQNILPETTSGVNDRSKIFG